MADLANYLINGLAVGAIYALIAVGYTMVYGIIKLINFAHGEFYMFGAFAGYAILSGVFGARVGGGQPGLAPLLATALLAGLVTGLLAVAVERLCYRPLRHAGRIMALLAALGVSLFLQNLGQQTVGAEYRSFPPTVADQRYPYWTVALDELRPDALPGRDLVLLYSAPGADGRAQWRTDFLADRRWGAPDATPEAVERQRADWRARLTQARELAADPARRVTIRAVSPVAISTRQLVLVVTLALVATGLYLLVQHTRFGRAMRAISVDYEAAQLMGVNVDRVITGTFFTGAFVAGLGGVLAGGMYYERIDPLMGLLPGLKAFIAAVLGGIGSIPGAILGALLLGLSEELLRATPWSGMRDALAFAILIGVLLIRPGGILGRFEGEKV